MRCIKIGRSSTNDIVVPDDLVTRECHCQIVCDDSGLFFVMDESTNGTFVNGMRIARGVRHPLRSTDVIKIGRTPLPWLKYVQGYMTGSGITKATVWGDGSLHEYGGKININIGGNVGVGNAGNGNGNVHVLPTPTPTPIPLENSMQPDNFLVWSILGTIFCCLPFGIPSIVNASKVDRLWLSGDKQGAREAVRKARTWFWWSFGVGLAGHITNLIVYSVLIYDAL